MSPNHLKSAAKELGTGMPGWSPGKPLYNTETLVLLHEATERRWKLEMAMSRTCY